MPTETPTLSIITINRNNAEGLHKTMESVLTQTSNDFEYIIIDGASTDNSVEVIKEFLAIPEYATKITYWVSEPDKGIYNAINKGIIKANGEFCLFLNSGDYLYANDSIKRILDNFDNSFDVFYTNACLVYNKKCIIKYFPENIDINFFISETLNHQNCIIKRQKLFDKNFYDETFSIVSDWFFFIDGIYNNELKFKKIEMILSKYDCNGLSSQNYEKQIEERRIVLEKIFGKLAITLNRFNVIKSFYFVEIQEKYGSTRLLRFFYKLYIKLFISFSFFRK